MLLETLEVQDFRNLSGKVSFGPGLNVLHGPNGQGKTNWLEAIDLLATTRSFKTVRLQEAIRFNEELAMVRGRVRQSEDLERELQVTLQGNIRSLSVNGKRESLQRYLGQLHAFTFTSDALEIVRGLPEFRRKFLDRSIVSLHPPFIETFSDYSKVLKQKNSLLHRAKDEGDAVEKTRDSLLPWNDQLVALAGRIHKGRVRVVERLNEVLERRLFNKEEVAIRYLSSLEGKGDLTNYEDLVRERLRIRVQAELAAGYSLIGPHRDDLEITMDGIETRKYGSAGQQRSALLLLLLAGIEVFNATRGEYPIFLLDDIDAELDHCRIGLLLEFIEGKSQTFVTTSKDAFVQEFGKGAGIFLVENGTAAPAALSAI
ncbi:MAG: DNA replication and repair protein RecF [Blastocatellia bacterium]|nr:DNA replication and repair protein RecF [Blastocatellia bacterium]